MKSSEAAERYYRANGLEPTEADITFIMLGDALQNGGDVRTAAVFRLTRMRHEHGLWRFLMPDYWRWLRVSRKRR